MTPEDLRRYGQDPTIAATPPGPAHAHAIRNPSRSLLHPNDPRAQPAAPAPSCREGCRMARAAVRRRIPTGAARGGFPILRPTRSGGPGALRDVA